MSPEKSIEAEQSGRLRLFEKSLCRRNILKYTESLLGPTDGMTCLAIGGDALVHYHLAKRGGDWLSAGLSEAEVVELGAFVGKNVRKIRDGKLPFEEGQFDRIVMVGGLEHVTDDHSFIRDCHRVLKESGVLVLVVRHAKSWTMVRPLRKMLGMGKDPEAVRVGYTSKDLFDVLKDGFDVEDVTSFSRFFLELSDMIFQLIGGFVLSAGSRQAVPGVLDAALYDRAGRYFSVVYPFLWLADSLVMMLCHC